MKSKKMIKPGLFAKPAAADIERENFDRRNEEILALHVNPDVVFIGDSITQFWDVTQYFDDENLFFVNRGIGGDIAENVMKRFMADVVQLEPSVCICMVGINDAHELLMLPDNEESTKQVIVHIVSNLGRIIQMAKENGILIVICSVTPSNCQADVLLEDRRNKMVPELNLELKALCDREKIPFVDYYSAMVLPGTLKLKADYTRDGIHPNANGYAIMAEVLSNTMKAWQERSI